MPRTLHIGSGGGVGYTDEQVDDRVAALLVAGNNIDITYDDVSNTLTIDVEALTSADIGNFAEAVDDRVAALIQNGTGISWSYDDVGGTLTPTVTITQYTDEMVDDRVGALIVAGNNIDVTYNDGAGTLTIDVETLTAADISDFNEVAQDAVGGILTDTTSINFTYNDATNTITADVNDIFVSNTGDQIDGNLIIDNTGTEVFLIRKNADAGDLMGWDTTNLEVALSGEQYVATDGGQVAEGRVTITTGISSGATVQLNCGVDDILRGYVFLAGSGAYTYNIDLMETTAKEGQCFTILITMPASTNPTVVIRDDNSGSPVARVTIAGTGSAFSVGVRMYYTGTTWNKFWATTNDY